MKKLAAPPVGGLHAGLGRLLVVAVAAIGAACASGGGGWAAMTRAEIDAMLARYAGNWALDESASSPRVTVPEPEARIGTRVVRADQLDDLRREAEEGQRLMAIRQATFELLRRRPEALVLGVQGDELVYSPTPGERIKLPLNGGWISQAGGEHRVRTRAFRDGPRLGVEHMVGSDGWVIVVLEVVEDRLEMTRTMRFMSERVAPIVLVYSRTLARRTADGLTKPTLLAHFGARLGQKPSSPRDMTGLVAKNGEEADERESERRADGLGRVFGRIAGRRLR